MVSFVDEPAINAALADVRNDGTETNWCLVAYPMDQVNQLELVGYGSGGVDELKGFLNDSTCFYGLVRVQEVIDEKSLTIKFCFIKYLGQNVKPTNKAKLTTHAGILQTKFKPYHVELIAEEQGEVSQEIVQKLVSDASMSKSKVVNQGSNTQSVATSLRPKVANAQQQANLSKPLAKTTSSGSDNLFQGTLDEIKEAIADVRSDATETDWCLTAYTDENMKQIAFVAKGSGGADTMSEQLQADNIFYGLVRVQDVIDNSVTVKFVFVQYIGSDVKPMARARVSTHKGNVTALFLPHHCELFAATPAEISSAVVQKLVGETSMSSSKVLNKEGDKTATKAAPTQQSVRSWSPQQQNAPAQPTAPRPKGQIIGGLEFLDLDGIKAAISDVRSDKKENDWVLLTYVNDAGTQLGLVGTGVGGADAIAEHLNDSGIFYGMVRTTDEIDNNTVVKFAMIQYLGANVKIMTKAKNSTFKGQITSFFHPTHVELFASSISEVTSAAVQKLITDASMSSSKVLGEQKTQTTTTTTRAKPNTQSGSFEFVFLDSIKEAIADVRSDATETDWALVGFTDDTTTKIGLFGKGTGGVDGLKENLADDTISYGIVRTSDMIDNHTVVKFAFIQYLGSKTKTMAKAKASTYKGQITALFNPYHIELFADTREQITAEAVNKLITDSSMSASKVVANNANKPQTVYVGSQSKVVSTAATASPLQIQSKRSPSTTTTSPKTSSNASASVLFDEENVKNALADVRADSTPTNWALFGYADQKTIGVIGLGADGINELKSHLDSKQVLYGLVRVTEVIDKSVTVKFVFVYWLGDDVPPMAKARVTTHKGAVEAKLAPYHTTIFANSQDEVTEELITKEVGKASMSFSNVK